MTGFNTHLLLLKVKVGIPYQKVIDYVNHVSCYRKAVHLKSGVCVCVYT